MTIDTYYANMSDRLDRIEATRPHTYGGDAAVASLRAFRRYHPAARLDYVEHDGTTRWMTAKQMRIHAVVARLSVSQGHLTMRSIALECGVSPGTVSRTILKLQAWGWFAVDVVRGRNGGIRVWAVVGDRFRLYAVAAKQKIRELSSRLNVAFTTKNEVVGTDATFSPTFAQRVMYERGMLALTDSEGESDPLTIQVDRDALLGQPKGSDQEVYEARQDKALREAAFADDWQLWLRIRNEMGPRRWKTQPGVMDAAGPAFSEADAPLVSVRVLS